MLQVDFTFHELIDGAFLGTNRQNCQAYEGAIYFPMPRYRPVMVEDRRSKVGATSILAASTESRGTASTSITRRRPAIVVLESQNDGSTTQKGTLSLSSRVPFWSAVGAGCLKMGPASKLAVSKGAHGVVVVEVVDGGGSCSPSRNQSAARCSRPQINRGNLSRNTLRFISEF